MGYLNSTQIERCISQKNINIDPYYKEFQGPNLYYCHLGNNFLIPKKIKTPADPLKDTSKYFKQLNNYKKQLIFKPGEFILAETFEFFSTEDDYIIRLFNSSSIARLGISHCAVGMINPGCGKKRPIRLTLELVNNSPFPIILQPTVVMHNKVIVLGTEILKVGVLKINKKVEKSYSDWQGSLYGHDNKVKNSQMHKRYKNLDNFSIPNNSILFKKS